MLADVLKERDERRRQKIEEERSKYNKPYKRDTIIYFDCFNIIGGVETWIYNLGLDYEFSVVYDRAHKEQIDKLESIGIETIKYVGQPIECNTLIFCLFGNANKIKAKKRYLFIHGIYETREQVGEIPQYDDIYAVSETASDYFFSATGVQPKVLYNPVKIEPTIKPLVIGVFSRLSSEKGRKRLIEFTNRLIDSGKPFLLLIFTDLPFECEDDRVVFIKPVTKIAGWVSICDYICQLSDTEAGCLTAQESLTIGKPLIITKLPILEEFNINNSNSKVLEFDLSNLDIDDLWNIPKVNKWQVPISKEWDSIMKKRTFREKYSSVVESMIEQAKESGADYINIYTPKDETNINEIKSEKDIEKYCDVETIDVKPKKTRKKKSDK